MKWRNQNAQIVWEPTAGVYRVSVDINWRNNGQKGFPFFVKSTIPSSERSFDGASKSWFFSEQYFSRVKVYVELFWSNVFVYTKEQSDQFQAQAQSQDQSYYQATVHDINKYVNQFLNILVKHNLALSSSKLDLTNDKDYEQAQKYYRIAVRKLHPDINPSGAEDMSKLNEAWSYIKQEREVRQNANI